ncbi:MAG: hypothetical protein KGJ13_12660 [Patescibacteria group bacterium]|nr:hypothetical protein [Patescibacteria group bacterium]
MARKKAEKTPVQIAADKAREHYKTAKEKAEKAPNNEGLKKALKDAAETMHTATATERRERFLRVGSNRVTKAIKALQNLRQVANPRSYAFTGDDVGEALEALKREYEGVSHAFEQALKGSEKGGNAPAFSFSNK